jgi:glycosyltransferase EpsF
MNIIRLQLPELKMDFILAVKPGESGDYEREALAAGCRIFYRPSESWISKRLRIIGLSQTPPTLYDTLRDGNYDVLHVHGSEFDGDTVKEAFLAGTPIRVAHCHHTKIARGKGGPEMWVRWARYLTIDRARILRYATNLVACGRDAGRLLVGRHWDTDLRCQVIYCGVPVNLFDLAIKGTSRAELLAKYRMPADAIVIGHAGSMGPVPVKNHSFLVRAFAELSKRNNRYYLFLAGDGPLRHEIESQVSALGITNRVRMPGLLPDVPAHMIHLFDVHVLPSLAEGLPVVTIEAAAAGLYTLMSTNITDEIEEHLPGRSERLTLNAPLKKWADRIEFGISAREQPQLGIARVRASQLSIEQSARDLISMYRSQAKNSRPTCAKHL